jgi:proteasome maturation protein
MPSQEPSLRIAPPSQPKAASVADTANSLGLHDTLRHGPRSLAVETAGNGTSSIQSRLENVRGQSSDSFPILLPYDMHTDEDLACCSGTRRRIT